MAYFFILNDSVFQWFGESAKSNWGSTNGSVYSSNQTSMARLCSCRRYVYILRSAQTFSATRMRF